MHFLFTYTFIAVGHFMERKFKLLCDDIVHNYSVAFQLCFSYHAAWATQPLITTVFGTVGFFELKKMFDKTLSRIYAFNTNESEYPLLCRQ